MSKPDETPLSIKPQALQQISQHALADRDVEVCGFLLGRGGVGSHVIAVRNVAADPTASFEMSHQGILESMKEADEKGLDVLAVYHSHPHSEARPSVLDREALDLDPALLIVSLKDGAPRCRAWRLDVPYVGERRATEVMLHVSEDGQPFLMKPSVLPWALSMGNEVLIEYRRSGATESRTLEAKVVGAPAQRLNDEAALGMVHLSTPRKADPKALSMSRIEAVTVLKETVAAQRMRHKLAMLGRQAAHLISQQRYDDVPEILAVLTAAYPPGMLIKTKEDK